MIKVIDNRKNEELRQFCQLEIGDGFEWNGRPYIKVNDEYAFDLVAIQEEEVGDWYMNVTPLNITITIEK